MPSPVEALQFSWLVFLLCQLECLVNRLVPKFVTRPGQLGPGSKTHSCYGRQSQRPLTGSVYMWALIGSSTLEKQPASVSLKCPWLSTRTAHKADPMPKGWAKYPNKESLAPTAVATIVKLLLLLLLLSLLLKVLL